MSKSRIKELDIARALSMMIILLHHAPNYTEYFNGSPVWYVIHYFASWALGSFVFCSGFLIGSRYTFNSGLSIRQFYTRRLFRIMPMFAVSLLSWHPAHPILVSLASLTGIINFIDMPNVFTLWFVSMILVFYVAAPLICRKEVANLIIAVVLEVILWLGAEHLGWEARMWLYFPCFAVGAITAKLDARLQKALCMTGAIMAIALWIFWPIPEGFASILRPLWGSGGMIGIAWIIGRAKIFDKLFSILAFSSMAAYMFHRQIFIFFRDILGFPADGFLRATEILLVCIPTILVAGFFIQKIYDKGQDLFWKHIFATDPASRTSSGTRGSNINKKL